MLGCRPVPHRSPPVAADATRLVDLGWRSPATPGGAAPARRRDQSRSATSRSTGRPAARTPRSSRALFRGGAARRWWSSPSRACRCADHPADQRLYTLSGNGNWPRTDAPRSPRGGVRPLRRPQARRSRLLRVHRPGLDVLRPDAHAASAWRARRLARPAPRRRLRRLRRARAARCAAPCAATLPTSGRAVLADAVPAGLATCFAGGGRTTAPLKAMVHAHKEHGVLALAGRSAGLLALPAAAPALGASRVRAGPGAVAAGGRARAAATTRCCAMTRRAARGCGRDGVRRAPSAGCSSYAAAVARPGRARRRAAGRQPGGLDVRARARRAGSRGGPPVSRRGLRRRAHHRRHRARGAACAGGVGLAVAGVARLPRPVAPPSAGHPEAALPLSRTSD